MAEWGAGLQFQLLSLFFHELGNVHAPTAQLNSPGHDPREVQDVVDHAAQPAALGGEQPKVFLLAHRVGGLARLQHFAEHLDAGDRRAQLVRDVVHEVALELGEFHLPPHEMQPEPAAQGDQQHEKDDEPGQKKVPLTALGLQRSQVAEPDLERPGQAPPRERQLRREGTAWRHGLAQHELAVRIAYGDQAAFGCRQALARPAPANAGKATFQQSRPDPARRLPAGQGLHEDDPLAPLFQPGVRRVGLGREGADGVVHFVQFVDLGLDLPAPSPIGLAVRSRWDGRQRFRHVPDGQDGGHGVAALEQGIHVRPARPPRPVPAGRPSASGRPPTPGRRGSRRSRREAPGSSSPAAGNTRSPGRSG